MKSKLLVLPAMFLWATASVFTLTAGAQPTSPVIGTTVTKLTTPALSQSEWTTSYFGYYSSEIPDFETKNSGLYTLHLLSISRQLNPRYKLSLRPSFTIETAGVRYGEQAPAKTALSETAIALVDKSPFPSLIAIASRVTYKIILPTDPAWVQAKTYGALGANLSFEKFFPSGLSIGYSPKLQMNFQRYQEYLKKTGSTTTATPTQKGFVEQWLKASQVIASKVSISQGIGLKNYQYYPSSRGLPQNRKSNLLETSLNIELSDTADLSLGIGQENQTEKNSFKAYRSAESSYVIMTNIRL